MKEDGGGEGFRGLDPLGEDEGFRLRHLSLVRVHA